MSTMASILTMLRQNTSLQILNLGRTGITDMGIKVLADGLKDNHSLLSLNVEWNRIRSGRQLVLTLSHNTCLKALYLGGNPNGDTKMGPLSDFLKTNSTLQILSLEYCGISD